MTLGPLTEAEEARALRNAFRAAIACVVGGLVVGAGLVAAVMMGGW